MMMPSKSKKQKEKKEKQNLSASGHEYEALSAFDTDGTPLGISTGLYSAGGAVSDPKSGRRYVRLAGVAPLETNLGSSVPELMMPPVLPSEEEVAAERAENAPMPDRTEQTK